jgi:pimeloyl-ACP methyl ester carboxylesterase
MASFIHAKLWMNEALYKKGFKHAEYGIIAVHGIYQASSCWDNQRELVEGNNILIAIDLPLHGQSEIPPLSHPQPDMWAKSMQAVVEHFSLKEKPLIFMGWSFGAWCIGSYIKHYGLQHIQGLILVSGLFGDIQHILTFVQEQHQDALESLLMLNNTAASTEQSVEALQHFVTQLRYGAYKTPNDYYQTLGYNIQSVQQMHRHHVNVLDMIGGEESNLEDIYAELNHAGTPILMMVGENDTILPIAWMKSIARHLPQASIVEQSQCGHSFFAEYPHVFNNATRTFIHGCVPSHKE